MKHYLCDICGFTYREELGVADDNVAAGTRWQDLPDGWVCPDCGAGKELFLPQKEER